MSLLRLCQWLASTRGSIALHESLWGYPAIATVHVMALPLFVGMIAILDLRLLGVRMPHVPISEIAQRLLPWVAAGFVVLILSGSLLFYSDPVRYYPNIFLRLKLALVIASGVNAWVFHRSGYLTAAERGLHPAVSRGARAAGLLSLLLLAAIILAGRLIAYYDEWFDCSRHPHSAIVTFIAGCAGSR
jgi:hypothetical protein